MVKRKRYFGVAEGKSKTVLPWARGVGKHARGIVRCNSGILKAKRREDAPRAVARRATLPGGLPKKATAFFGIPPRRTFLTSGARRGRPGVPPSKSPEFPQVSFSTAKYFAIARFGARPQPAGARKNTALPAKITKRRKKSRFAANILQRVF